MRIITTLLAVMVFCFASVAHAAPKYPTKPIQLVVPYAPGGGSDVTARIFAEALKDILPQPVVVSNIMGANGQVAAAQILQSRPDGYTILWEHTTLTITPNLSDSPFTWTDFDLVCVGALSENVMIVRKDSPWNSVADVVKAIKENPGKIRFATSMKSLSHFMYLDFAKDAGGLDALLLPMTGDKPRIVAMLGNNCDITTVAYGSAAPYIASGDIKVLAFSSENRSEFAPDVPTFAELGMKNVYLEFLYSVFLPKGTPEPVRQTIFEAFKKAAEKPETAAALKAVNVSVYFKTGEEGRALFKKQGDAFMKTVLENGLLKK